MQSRTVVADASFYLCFLEDIRRPDVLIFVNPSFDFMITPIVFDEVSVCSNYGSIKGKFTLIQAASQYNMTEILRPFFAENQVKKGESEVIALAFFIFDQGDLKNFILDDEPARKFVLNNLPILKNSMTGTVGFIALCACEYSLMTKEYSLQVLKEIERSPFRIESHILSNIIDKISNYC